MSKKKWGCLLLIFFILALFLYPVLILEVRTEKTPRTLLFKKVSSGEQFEFRYIHSVEKIPVSGLFLITSGGMIKHVETHFPSYGPGLPFMKGEVILEKDKMKTGPKIEEMEQFSFFVSPITNQCLIYKEEKLDFSSIEEGEIITVKVKEYPLGGVLFKHGRP
jgi:hypothetical protein